MCVGWGRMTSLYLGKIGNADNIFEIHALTNNLPFREYKKSEISDSNLFKNILRNRFKLLESGVPIFCTAINPDIHNEIEVNPHDSREGTVHFVAINKFGDISCTVSVAVDIGERYNGGIVGLPLENCWQRNGFPEGTSLNSFRQLYLPLNYNINRHIAPWEMAELYRHFKIPNGKDNLSCRLGVYTGCYHLLVREAKNKGLTPTAYWLFDAIPAYFNLYRYAGAAVLREFIISHPIRNISPNRAKVEKRVVDGQNQYFYDDNLISRSIKVPFPHRGDSSLIFKYKHIPFLDGVIDIYKCEKSIKKSPFFLNVNGVKGMSLLDRIQLRFGLGVIGKRVWDEDYLSNKIFSNILNYYILKKTGSSIHAFNSIGRIKKTV